MRKHVLFWHQNIKVPFGMGHPHLHIKPIRVWESSGVTNLQAEFNYLDSFMFYRVFMIWASLAQWSWAGGWGVSWMISVSLDELGVLRGKKFQSLSNYLD